MIFLRLLSEEKVLKKLGIRDFRSMTKDKTIKLVSMLDRMDPEVAKKAIEQFPHFADTSIELLNNYKGILSDAIKSNNESNNSVMDTYNTIINELLQLLQKENLSFDEKKYILEQIKEFADRIDKKDKENKGWLMGVITVAASAIVGTILALGNSLGSNTLISQNNDNYIDDKNDTTNDEDTNNDTEYLD